MTPTTTSRSARLEPELWAGLGGASRNACVALCAPSKILGVCEQERITRHRAAGFNGTGLPDEALDELLRRANLGRSDITGFAAAECGPAADAQKLLRLDHHLAHACSSFLTSPFESASIVICDHESPQVSVWMGSGTALSKIDWPWQGPGFAEVYSSCASALGFGRDGHEQRMEASARLNPGRHHDRATGLFGLEDDRLEFASDWTAQVEGWVAGMSQDRASAVATALQSRIGDLLIEFLAKVKRRCPPTTRLCVGGSLFYNSFFNARVKEAGVFEQVFVPINPGNAGLSVGSALHANGQVRTPVTPFLGPSYSAEEIKATLDNCKLNYAWASQSETVAIAVEALQKGHLVAWFDGAMEWGPRALGARSILANPFSPYVLENLNRFLKNRPTWRGYALSGLEPAVREHFEGSHASPYMECDYVPKDRGRFQHILPGPNAALRVHTVGAEAPRRLRALLASFGAVSGMPIVVNTSFNGFREPIVCSPRDAIRVFFGTGIDILILDQFVVRK